MDVVTAAEPRRSHLIFTYGTLKRGFSNHPLIQALVRSGNASFLGVHRTTKPYPLVCGPFRVPFLLDLPGKGERVTGELYTVSTGALEKMDELEGVARGHYERMPITVVPEDGDGSGAEVEAEVYFGHRGFAAELWRRSGEKGFRVYSEKEAADYVKRIDRPKDVPFLDLVMQFISVSSHS